MRSVRVVPLFETPVYSLVVPDHAALDAALRAAILSRRAGERSVSLSNVGGWQSSANMSGWGGEAAAGLARHVAGLCNTVVSRMHAPGAPGVEWQCEMWANVNEAGHSNQSHWHPGSFLSAVYYVDNGYGGSDDRSLGGELVFIDPRMPYLRMRTPDLRHRGADGSADEQETWMRPQPGMLVVFPSFLAHSVRPYQGAGTRISIAVNMLVRHEAR
ncbi:TIGR02466 family protein [Sphingomonas solaris]|uniref:2OG-Fe(II) oxygenase n=1 Tax=Alterirhizorhabdus solaris TaxID=2529389 RepID=A0A558R532_9SPHN|nr:TIGR02466 family protein [Sphingomonas solaris]TVV74494.1 hypothetical protein FOY91_09515 [Sphingomonas solaris]